MRASEPSVVLLREMRAMNLDEIFPPMGPCAFCVDGTDARHRIFDAIRDRVKAGEDIAEVAGDYDISVEAVQAVLAKVGQQ